MILDQSNDQGFLSALRPGKLKCPVTTIEPDRVSGTVIYAREDPEGQQDFCWHMSEANLPSESAYHLACLIKEQSLLDIDKITVARDDLRHKYNDRF